MATRYWVGGTGTWDASTTTHWASSSGGAGGASVPTTLSDVAIFDGSSGGGTVTVDATINGLNLNGITCGAFTGTLDFSALSALTISGSFNVSGTGTRTINLGSATYSLTATNVNVWDATTITGLNLSGTYTILLTTPTNGNTQTFTGGGASYANISIAGRTNGSQVNISGNNTIGSLSISGPAHVLFTAASTNNITNALAWNASSSNPISVHGDRTGATLAIASGSVASWAALKGLTFTGNSLTASNSFNLGNNTNATISAPSGGGGVVGVIGS